MRRPADQRHRGRRGVAALILGVLATVASALPADAHDVLISSSPAAGASLAQAPTAITLVFDQNVENINAEMAITIGSGQPVLFTPQVKGPQVTADLTQEHLTIPDGPEQTAWKIGYRIVSADGHPVSGLVNFTVGTAPAAKTGQALATNDSRPNGGLRWPWIAGAAMLLVVIAAAAVVLLRRRRAA